MWNSVPYQRGLYFLGCYLAAKWGYKTLSGLYTAFKTYALPRVWPKNLKEYGEWAGKYLEMTFEILVTKLGFFSGDWMHTGYWILLRL